MANTSTTANLSARSGSPQNAGTDFELLLSDRSLSDTGKPSFSVLDFLLPSARLRAPLLPSLHPQAGTSRILVQVALACVGAYLFGYHLSVVNGPMDSMAADLGFLGNSVAKGSVVSSFLVGAFLGCLGSSNVADGLGRRRAFLVMALPVMLGSALSALSASLPLMVAGRFLVGLGLGIGSPLPTIYISEIAPPSLRGTLSSLPQVAACAGILLAMGVGAFFPGTPQGWRWCFWVGSVPAACLVLMTEYMIESPRWLAQKGMWSEAQKAVEALQGVGSAAAHQALADLKASSSQAQAQGSKEVSWMGLLSREYRHLIFIGCALFALQQLSGINAVFYFSSNIFKSAGVQSEVEGNIAIGVANLAAAVVSTFLMDRCGRKPLLLNSFLAMGASLGLQAVCTTLCSVFPAMSWIAPPVALAGTLTYVMAFAIGAGPVPGLLLPEMYPTQIRAKGFAVALSFYWILNCALGLLFLPLLEALGSAGANTLFGTMCFAAALFTHRYIIETKGKTLEEVEAEIAQR